MQNLTPEGVLARVIGPNAAHSIAGQYSSWTELAQASDEQLLQLNNLGAARLAQLRGAFELARRLAREALGESPLLDTPDRVADLLREEHRAYAVEQFTVVLLNTRRRLVKIVKLATGTLDTVLVHPREVFKAAIAANAAAIVVAHNHPSGEPLICTGLEYV